MFNVAFSLDHLRHPFTPKNVEAKIKPNKLERFKSALAYLAITVLTAGIGTIFYFSSAYLKSKNIKKISVSDDPTAARVNAAATGLQPENKFLKKDKKKVIGEFIDFLRKENRLDQEGIFRISGSISKIEKMEESGVINNECSVYDAADVFKRYIKELKLIDGKDARDAFLSITAVGKGKEFIGKLSEEDREILKTLICFLGEVEQREKNKMGAAALATVWGPNLVYIEKVEPLALLEIIGPLNTATEFLIENRDEIFKS